MEEKVIRANWFGKHLHTTLVFAWVVCLMGMSFIMGVEEVGLLSTPLALGLMGLSTVLVYWVWWWVLSKKGRSHWFMLLLGIGLLVTLWLENKKGCNG